MSRANRTKTEQKRHTRPFEDDLRLSLQKVRLAMADVIAATGSDATRPQEMSRQLGLDKSLSWKLAKVLGEQDLIKVATHLPRRAGLSIALRSFAQAGAPKTALDSVRAAMSEFDRVVELHCGDRDTLDVMVGQLGSDRQPQLDEAHRKKAFQGNSAIWGVQARIRYSTTFLTLSETPGMLDIATVSGLVDFRRLRGDVPWAVASITSYGDANPASPQAPDVAVPLDPQCGPHDPPVLRDFCSKPTPQLRGVTSIPGVSRYELVEGPVGRTSTCTCLTGWARRGFTSRYGSAADRFGEILMALNTPAEFCLHDLYVHRELTEAQPPSAHLYSQLPGGPVYPQCGPDRGTMPLSESMIDLGRSPPDIVSPDYPDHARLVLQAMDWIGLGPNDFAGYRMQMRFPPIPTAQVFRYTLPPAP